MTRLMSTLALALLFVASTGCASYSEDRAVYHSTYMSPKTVHVTDVISGEAVWTYDVPPGHILMVEFDVGSGTLESVRQERGYPTRMEWALYPETAGRSLLRKNHFRGSSVESGEQPLMARPIRLGFTVGQPIDPTTSVAPRPRTIEEIERDINADDLPEPDAAEEGAQDAADAVEESVDDEMGEE